MSTAFKILLFTFVFAVGLYVFVYVVTSGLLEQATAQSINLFTETIRSGEYAGF